MRGEHEAFAKRAAIEMGVGNPALGPDQQAAVAGAPRFLLGTLGDYANAGDVSGTIRIAAIALESFDGRHWQVVVN